jgi:hypothetical protein
MSFSASNVELASFLSILLENSAISIILILMERRLYNNATAGCAGIAL